MKKTIVISLLAILFTRFAGAMLIQNTQDSDKNLSQGLHFLALGNEENALECFLNALEKGNKQEKLNARLYINSMLADELEDPSKKVSMFKSALSSNNAAQDQIGELLGKNTQQISDAQKEIDATTANYVSCERIRHLHKMINSQKYVRTYQEQIPVIRKKLELAYRALYQLESERMWLLERMGRTADSEYQFLYQSRAVQKTFFPNLEDEVCLFTVVENDLKNLYTVEAQYYVCDGKICITSGLIPKKIEPIVLLEEQKRIAFGQHMKEAQLIREGKKPAIISGFIPEKWREYLIKEVKDFYNFINSEVSRQQAQKNSLQVGSRNAK